MNQTTSGWILFIVSLGMMCGLLSSDVSKLTEWGGAVKPAFIAVVMAHFSSVVLAFVGGKLIPETRTDKQTRSTDKKEEE